MCKQDLKAERVNNTHETTVLVQIFSFKQALERAFERKRLNLDAQQQLEEDEQHQSELSAALANIVDDAGADVEDNKKTEREKHNEIVSLSSF